MSDQEAHFANDFVLVFQIRFKICFALIQIATKWSIQNSAYTKTAVFLRHVQKFVTNWQGMELKQDDHQIQIVSRKIF